MSVAMMGRIIQLALMAMAVVAVRSGGQVHAAPPPSPVPDLGTRPSGQDWPDFLGPHRNGKSDETGLQTRWSVSGPPIVWHQALGTGYAMCTISRGRLFQFDRYGPLARLTCMHSETGRELWRFEYPTDYEDYYGYNNGPRTSPVVDADRVYIFGAEGMIHCLRVTDGAVVWKLDTTRKYGVMQNFFGVGSAPLIEQEWLIAQIGGSPTGSPDVQSGRVVGHGSGIVAFDKWTGEEQYRITDELASYSSPIAASIDGRRWCFSFSRGGLVGFDPLTGAVRFHYPWRARILESVNASTPVVFGRRVFISETYGPGSTLLEISGDNYRVVWSDEEVRRGKAMQCHWNTPIFHEGYLYGSSGRHTNNAELRCIDAKDGKVMWSVPDLTRASLLYVDGHLVCLSEDGTLRLIRASAQKYDLIAEVILRDPDRPLLTFPAWSAPILAHGLLYVRGDSRLVCLEVIPQ